MRHSYFLASLLFLGACDEDPAKVVDVDGGAVDAALVDASHIDAGAIDATPPGAFQTLIQADWSLGEGEEGYVCATRTLTEDMYVHAIKPVAPMGTHHTVVSVINAPTQPDNPAFDCGVEFGQFYASGVGTDTLTLPDGVGLVAKKGSQVRLNLHLFNAGDGTLTGRSGIEVITIPAAEVEHVATVGLYGTNGLAITPSGQPETFTGEDDLQAGDTIIALFPHMHQIGTHFKAEILRGGETITVWDEPYQFESQEFSLIGPYVAQAGDQWRTSCTYVNTTGETVYWGDSSNAEMCFSIIMSY